MLRDVEDAHGGRGMTRTPGRHERGHKRTEMTMNGHLTREPPAAVKRQLRQEAAFGCCICGHPIYQYHHIRPFEPNHHHDPDDMMLLCPNHHHEATVGALEEAE
jgi:hypothetical protein